MRFLAGGHRNTGYWIALLLALLVLLNLAGLLVYAKAHPAEDGWEAVWSYLESDTAKLISASLVFPLLIFLVEGRFNLLETIRAARSERRKREQDERRSARLETIEETTDVWSRTTAWVGDVAFWDGQASLNDYLKESWKLAVAAEDAINGWARFRNTVEWDGPGSAVELETHFLRLANALLSSTQAVIYYLQATSDSDERENLKTSLLLIGNGINAAVHHPVRNVLYASLELMDIIESEDPDELRFISTDEEAAQRRSQLVASIDKEMETVASWSEVVKTSLDQSDVLATVAGDEVAALRASLMEDAAVVRERYLAVPRSERLSGWRIDFTTEWLDEFADELAFQSFFASLDELRSKST
jgi:hypothetical protein